MNSFQVGDIVRVANLGVTALGWGELVVSKVERDGLTEWISIEGYPQDGRATYTASVFQLVDRGINANE